VEIPPPQYPSFPVIPLIPKQTLIGEMEPLVFKALVHYIYNESLPNMDGADRSNRHEMLCHDLLEAADRYAYREA
jgi:hypothetical protein